MNSSQKADQGRQGELRVNIINTMAEYGVRVQAGNSSDLVTDLNRLITSEAERIEAKARDSEQNRLFAVLRHLDHLGIAHTATNIMKVRKEWDESAAAEAERQRLAKLVKGEAKNV